MKTIKELTEIRFNSNSDTKYELVESNIVKVSELYNNYIALNTNELTTFCYSNTGKLQLGLKIGVYLEYLHFAVLVNSKILLNLTNEITLFEKEKLIQLLELEEWILKEMKDYENN